MRRSLWAAVGTSMALLSWAGCDSESAQPPCDAPTRTAAGADVSLQARVTVLGDTASVQVALGGKEEDSMGLLRLTSAQHIALFKPAPGASAVGEIDEDTEVALLPPAEGCGTGDYTADVSAADFLADGMVVRLTEGAGFDARRVLQGGGATPRNTPTEVIVGQPFDVPLDHDLPTMGGTSWSQDWDLKLRGDCIVPASDDAYPLGPKDFAYAVDQDQVGSDQRPTLDQEAHFTVPADVVVPGSQGCQVTATFVVATTSSVGGAAVTIPGSTMVRVEAPAFTFQLEPAVQ